MSAPDLRHSPSGDPAHAIEEHVKVYLYFDGQAWQVDDATTDGYALDGLDNGPSAQECYRNHATDEERAACRAALERACGTDLPNADELAVLLGAALAGRQTTDAVRS